MKRIVPCVAVVLALTGCPEEKKATPPPAAQAPAPTPTPQAAPAAPAPAAAAPAAAEAAADSGAAPAAAAAPAAPAAPTVDAKADAADIFKVRCSTCHGLEGKGDGPASAALNPKPRNYTDAKWQDSVTDEHIEKTIVQGGASVGLSPLMVPNPDLAAKPETVKELRKIIRGFKGK
ncbi:MAG: hypothetical protein QM723_28560 [Myxococcaceae bacterium]